MRKHRPLGTGRLDDGGDVLDLGLHGRGASVAAVAAPAAVEGRRPEAMCGELLRQLGPGFPVVEGATHDDDERAAAPHVVRDGRAVRRSCLFHVAPPEQLCTPVPQD